MKVAIALGLTALLSSSVAFAQSDKDEAKFEKSQQNAPDNSSKNQRDNKLGKATAEDQSNTKSDREIARHLRKEIMAKKGLSTNAQNVKLITENGVLMLRGPVDSQQEKDLIGDMAKQCCGARSYTNQLEVKGKNSQ
jgi:osmotically-inducible protein OsmY